MANEGGAAARGGQEFGEKPSLWNIGQAVLAQSTSEKRSASPKHYNESAVLAARMFFQLRDI